MPLISPNPIFRFLHVLSIPFGSSGTFKKKTAPEVLVRCLPRLRAIGLIGTMRNQKWTGALKKIWAEVLET